MYIYMLPVQQRLATTPPTLWESPRVACLLAPPPGQKVTAQQTKTRVRLWVSPITNHQSPDFQRPNDGRCVCAFRCQQPRADHRKWGVTKVRHGGHVLNPEKYVKEALKKTLHLSRFKMFYHCLFHPTGLCCLYLNVMWWWHHHHHQYLSTLHATPFPMRDLGDWCHTRVSKKMNIIICGFFKMLQLYVNVFGLQNQWVDMNIAFQLSRLLSSCVCVCICDRAQ